MKAVVIDEFGGPEVLRVADGELPEPGDGPLRRIEREVKSWPGVTTGGTGRGGLRFSYGKVELGHIQGSNIADLPFPRKVRDNLIERGLASVHPPVPDSGWVRRLVNGPGDAQAAIGLFRMNYDRAKAHAGLRAASGAR